MNRELMQEAMAPRLETKDVILAANGQAVLPIFGMFFYLLEATGAVRVALDNIYQAELSKGIGFKALPGQRFQSVRITNLTAASNTVRIAFGVGDVLDNRTVITGSISIAPAATIPATADVALVAAAAAATVIAANANRRGVLLSNVGAANDARVGDAPAAAKGHRLQPGENVYIGTTAEVKGFSTGGTSISILELV